MTADKESDDTCRGECDRGSSLISQRSGTVRRGRHGNEPLRKSECKLGFRSNDVCSIETFGYRCDRVAAFMTDFVVRVVA